ncbi:MAG: hypothetical protein REH83_03050 [Rickettsiella sp.]|nr:hypothetical protein [Rickettsiella sp.]
MPISFPDLNFTIERYPLIGDKAIMLWKAEDKKKPQAFLQIQFIQENRENIDFTSLENYVTGYVNKLQNQTLIKRPILENADSPSHETLFINFLREQLKLNNPYLIDNKSLYTPSSNTPINVDFYCLETVECKSENKKIYTARFGYEMFRTMESKAQPVCSVEVLEDKANTITKKAYFFPLDELAVEKIKYFFTKTPHINTKTITSLRTPYVLYTPARQNPNYNSDIQTRIELQVIITNKLLALKKEKKSSSENIEKQLLELSQEISAGKPLEQIQNKINFYINKITLVSLSRLPFFKPKPESINVWRELEKSINTNADIEKTCTNRAVSTP